MSHDFLARVRFGPSYAALICALLAACATAEASDPAPATFETLVLHERAAQVTVAQSSGLARLDGPRVEQGVGGSILLNSELIVGGTFKAEPTASVDGGRVVGTMHGLCTTTGGGLSLSAGGNPGTVAKCEQCLNFYDRGQVVVSGLIEQQNFESNVAQHLAVIGGTGDFVGVRGQLAVTQLVFPGVIKLLSLELERPR